MKRAFAIIIVSLLVLALVGSLIPALVTGMY